MKRFPQGIAIALTIAFILMGAIVRGQSAPLTATGKVTAMNLQTRTISFSGKGTGGGSMPLVGGGTLVAPESYDVQMTVNIDNGTAIKIGDAPATLKDIHVGDTVTIRYIQSASSGAVIVKSIKKKK